MMKILLLHTSGLEGKIGIQAVLWCFHAVNDLQHFS